MSKYKFFGQPNMLVKGRKKIYFENKFQLKPLFRFDGNGEYVTDDEKLIPKLKHRFDHVEVPEEVEEIIEDNEELEINRQDIGEVKEEVEKPIITKKGGRKK